MGYPAFLDFDCYNCNMPNKMTYATIPRLNENRVSLANTTFNSDGSISQRIWRCRCTECNFSNMITEKF